MKSQFKIQALMCSLALIFAASSCNDKPEEVNPANLKPLDAPQLELVENGNKTFTIAWEAVANAVDYSYFFQDDLEARTTETTLTFSNLKPGEYVVRMKANPAADSRQWKDSKLTTFSVIVKEEYSFAISVSDLTFNSATISVTPSNARITYFYEVTTKEIMEKQGLTTSEAMAAYWKEYAESHGADLSKILVRGTKSATARLQSNTEYVAYAFGVKDDGTVTSELFTEFFTTPVMPDPDPALKAWEGTWTAVSSKTLTWNDNTGGNPVLTDEAKTETLTMTVAPNNPYQMLIYGWTTYGENTPAVALLSENRKSLDVYAGVAVGQAVGGYTPTWTAWCSMDGAEDNFVIGQFAAYSFTANGDTAECRLGSGQLSDGRNFETLQLGIYGVAGSRLSILDTEFPASSMAGTIKLTRTSSEVAVPAAVAEESEIYCIPILF